MHLQVLVVDDEPRVLETIGLLLERSGLACEVRTATSAKAAMDLLANTAADVVIADYRMPEMDGLELLVHIRDHYPDTRTILLTAFGSPAVTMQAQKLGALQVLRKPFEVHELLAAVRKAAAQSLPVTPPGL